MRYYVVEYEGDFGFIKPWTAVRDSVTFSQQFLTPSIIEGMEKKLFPELLNEDKGACRIMRHKLTYAGMSDQQEETQTRGLNKGRRGKSILTRGVLLYPHLKLAFSSREDAERAACQHICMCRNEDVMLPDKNVTEMEEVEFDALPGFELRFGQSESSFLVGYNRFDGNKPMYGWIECNGNSMM